MKISIQGAIIIAKAALFAEKAHRETNHFYDHAYPYIYHLEKAVDFGKAYVPLLEEQGFTEIQIVNMFCALYLHDIIEDARLTYNDIKQAFNEDVANLVFAVTNEKGKTRKDRANAKYYSEMKKAGLRAVFIKICDRLANVSHSTTTKRGMSEEYKKEYDGFREALFNTTLEPMWKELENYLFKH